MALVDDFKARFPEFKPAVADQYIPIYENIYQCYFCGDYSDCCDKEIILNLLAHLITGEITPGASGTPGNVLSKAVGNVSIQYGQAYSQSGLRDFFGSTKYGQRFLQLTSTRHGAVFV